MSNIIIPQRNLLSFVLGMTATIILLLGLGAVIAATVFDAGGGQISNVGSPVAAGDVATKAYADAAGKPKWEGYTSTAVDGNLGGVKGANQKCNGNYSGSHWASYEELIELGNAYPWTSSVWVRGGLEFSYDYVSSTSYYYAISEDGAFKSKSGVGSGKDWTGLTCRQWGSNGNSYYGLVLYTDGTTSFPTCNNQYKLACVS